MNFIPRSQNRFCEYLLVINIPEGGFLSFAVKLQKYVKMKYLVKRGTTSYPHLTLIHFCMYEEWEGRLFRLFRKSVEFITPFYIQPGNFLNFSNKTLIIDMKTENPITEILKQIRKLDKDERTKLIKSWYKLEAEYSDHPHVTVAKDMDRIDLTLALQELTSAYFKLKGFNVSQLDVLKKPWGGEKYEVAGIIPLCGNQDSLGGYQLGLF